MCSPYAVAPALFFAVRSQSPSRTRFVHLVYLTCSNRLRSRCLSWRSAFPSTSGHPLCPLRFAFLSTECFPIAPLKLFQTSPIGSPAQCVPRVRARGYACAKQCIAELRQQQHIFIPLLLSMQPCSLLPKSTFP